MKHRSEKNMMFYFLERIDYNQSWEAIELGIGYDLGDFRFSKGMSERILNIAKMIWIETRNVFNKDGHIRT